jgi:hypothetical protein
MQRDSAIVILRQLPRLPRFGEDSDGPRRRPLFRHPLSSLTSKASGRVSARHWTTANIACRAAMCNGSTPFFPLKKRAGGKLSTRHWTTSNDACWAAMCDGSNPLSSLTSRASGHISARHRTTSTDEC